MILRLDKTWLADGLPGVTADYARLIVQAAAFCWEHNGHGQELEMTVVGSLPDKLKIHRMLCTDQMRRAYADYSEAAEFGAYAIAFMLVIEKTPFTVVKRSYTGTGFDWWLGYKDDPLFQDAARLEVSGIMAGNDGTIDRRAKEKVDRLYKYRSPLPAYVVVAEFGQSKAKVVEHGH